MLICVVWLVASCASSIQTLTHRTHSDRTWYNVSHCKWLYVLWIRYCQRKCKENTTSVSNLSFDGSIPIHFFFFFTHFRVFTFFKVFFGFFISFASSFYFFTFFGFSAHFLGFVCLFLVCKWHFAICITYCQWLKRLNRREDINRCIQRITSHTLS